MFQKPKKKENVDSKGGLKKLNPQPDYITERLALWDRLKKEQDEKIQAKNPEDIDLDE